MRDYSKMEREQCPKCQSFNTMSFTTQQTHRCRQCKYIWGWHWDLRKEVDAAFDRVFGEGWNYPPKVKEAFDYIEKELQKVS